MEIGSILFILAILILAGAYLARPLLEPAAGVGVGPAHPQLSRLQARRERLLDAIRELDVDHAMGKVLPEEYQQHRRELTRQGAAVLRQIDELTAGPKPDTLEVELEARVARLREALGTGPKAAQPVAPARGQPEERAAGGRRAVEGRAARPARYCPICGAAALAEDRFCSNCGSPLQEPGD